MSIEVTAPPCQIGLKHIPFKTNKQTNPNKTNQPKKKKNHIWKNPYIFFFFSLGFESSDFFWSTFSVLSATVKTKSTHLQKKDLLLSCIYMNPVSGDFKKHLNIEWWPCCFQHRSVTGFVLTCQYTSLSICHDLSIKLWIFGTAELLLCNVYATLDLKPWKVFFYKADQK